MKLMNLAIAFALLAILGLGIFLFSRDPGAGLFLIIVGELGAFLCVWTSERIDRNHWHKKYIMQRIRR